MDESSNLSSSTEKNSDKTLKTSHLPETRLQTAGTEVGQQEDSSRCIHSESDQGKNVKKMFSELTSQSAVKAAISYTIPQLYEGKETYIGFYAFDPAIGKLRRKRIKLNFIRTKKERRERSRDIIKRLTLMLQEDWNPWIEKEKGTSYVKFNEVCNRFREYQDKLFSDGLIEKDSHRTFRSNLKMIEDYNSKRNIPISYIYQFDKQFIVSFLDYMYNERKVIPRTRDNYLAFCRKFVGWCMEKDYLTKKVDDGIKPLGKKQSVAKKRKIIPKEIFDKLVTYLKAQNDKHYLLAVYLTYYCFVRPKELSFLKIEYINIQKQTLFIPGDISKNDKDGVVTIPEVVIDLMSELRILDCNPSWYLFSTSCLPGKKVVHCDQFRKKWCKQIVPKLKFPSEYQFYSLKDTGITRMLHEHIDPLSVRDQARHHSIEMTNKYTPMEMKEANEKLKNYE